jgi:hypothetical protein
MADRCCRECRTVPWGVCRQSQNCWCHLEARTKDNWSGPLPYRDPTANQAVGNVTREERRRRKRKER